MRRASPITVQTMNSVVWLKSLWCVAGKDNKEGTAFAQCEPVTSHLWDTGEDRHVWRSSAQDNVASAFVQLFRERLQHLWILRKALDLTVKILHVCACQNLQLACREYHAEQLLFLDIKYWIANASISLSSHSKHNGRSCSNKAVLFPPELIGLWL